MRELQEAASGISDPAMPPSPPYVEATTNDPYSHAAMVGGLIGIGSILGVLMIGPALYTICGCGALYKRCWDKYNTDARQDARQERVEKSRAKKFYVSGM